MPLAVAPIKRGSAARWALPWSLTIPGPAARMGLIYGDTPAGDPVHSVGAYNEANGWAVVVTVYRPDPRRWVDWRTRRTGDDAV